MTWVVELHEDFGPEFLEFDQEVQDEILAEGNVLREFGPTLGRPYVDSLEGSKHSNMKELRVRGLLDQEWRVAFAFDTRRHAILLVAGDKQGTNQKRFYRNLINVADARFDKHLAKQKKGR